MQIKTQASSEMRVQNDILGNTAHDQLYSAFSGGTLSTYGPELIEKLQSSRVKKDALLRSFQAKKNPKDQLFMLTNLLLAGEGNGV